MFISHRVISPCWSFKIMDASPVRSGIYSGDVNQNSSIELNDVILTYNAAGAFAAGYIVTDLSCDSITNLNDILTAYYNSAAFVSVIRT